MVFLVIGMAMVIFDCILVKTRDSYIRPRHHLKVMVNTIMLSGLALIIVGIVNIATGGT